MKRKLVDYLPRIMQELEEFKQIMSAEQKQIDELWDCIYSVLNEAFVDSAEDTGLKRWEKILDIVPLDTDTTEVRRLRIHAKIMEDSLHGEVIKCYKPLWKDGYKIELKWNTLLIKVRK